MKEKQRILILLLSLTLVVTILGIIPQSLSAEEPITSLKEDAEELKVFNIHDVRGNLTLPESGENGSSITWESSDPSIITPTGEVKRPTYGDGDTTVKLTATFTLNDETITKSFMANVKEMPKKESFEGYLFSYFIGEGSSNGEQVYMALSQGNNPLNWQELNNSEPILTSDLGEKGLRDPFIIRSPEGDKFYLIATDLKINGNWDWDKAQRAGSKSIMVWESHDLINWSEQRMVEVSPEEAGNTWAPEVIYDDTVGEYIVFWASKLYDNEEHSGSSYQRIMYSKTRDFHTFTDPEVYMDYGYSIIDTTMIEHEGKIYRFTKDERSNTPSSPNGKFIFQEAGDSVFSSNFELIKEGVGKDSISQGEGAIIFKSNTEEKWYMFIDEFGGRGYLPFETTDLQSGEWELSENYNLPEHPRHGTVLPITKAEHEALLNNVPTIDPTAPEITFTGNEGMYPIDSKVEIACEVVDEETGIESVDCSDVDQYAYEYGVGDHIVSATATDKAGNTEEAETQFTVTVDYDSLSQLTESFVTKKGIAHSLTKKLESAQSSSEKGNKRAVEGKLKAYANQLSAQSGKSISKEDADLLVSFSQQLK